MAGGRRGGILDGEKLMLIIIILDMDLHGIFSSLIS